MTYLDGVGHRRPEMRILVVDDEREYGLMLFHLLERLGHDPVLAFDADHALDIIAADDIAGVITDISMPGKSGVELAQEIRATDGDMPIAFCTGSDPSDAIVRQAAELGPVLPKAGSIDAARAVIAEMAAAVNSRRGER